MRFAVCLLLLALSRDVARATDDQDAAVASFVGVVDFRHGPEPPIDVVTVTNKVGVVGSDVEEDGHKQPQEEEPNGADGSKGTHYGDPAEGCMKDEHPFQIQGVDGMICAPKCTAFRPCPSDLPEGVTAKPQCALKSPDGNTYCALICSPDFAAEDSEIDIDLDDDFMLRGAGASMQQEEQGPGECGAATCQAIGGAGICTYSE